MSILMSKKKTGLFQAKVEHISGSILAVFYEFKIQGFLIFARANKKCAVKNV